MDFFGQFFLFLLQSLGGRWLQHPRQELRPQRPKWQRLPFGSHPIPGDGRKHQRATDGDIRQRPPQQRQTHIRQ